MQPATAALEEAIKLSNAAPFSRKRSRDKESPDQTNDDPPYRRVSFMNMDDLLNSTTFLESGFVFPTIDWSFSDESSSEEGVQGASTVITKCSSLPEQCENQCQQTRLPVSRKRRRRRSKKGMLRCATFDSQLATMNLNVSGTGRPPNHLHFISSSPSLETSDASTQDRGQELIWTKGDQ